MSLKENTKNPAIQCKQKRAKHCLLCGGNTSKNETDA